MANARSAGYKFLTEYFQIKDLEHWCVSNIGETRSLRYTTLSNGVVEYFYPAQHWPGDSTYDHLEFAIKNEGINFWILRTVFPYLSPEGLSEFIASRPLSKHRRRLWFFYEFLLGLQLPLSDMENKGNYIDLLDVDDYYTAKVGIRISRQRLLNNLTGTAEFCPIVRRTEKLKAIENQDFTNQCAKILGAYSPNHLHRALSYLYTKETKSSFEIERITPSASRIEKFISLLALAEAEDFCAKDRLIELQNMIVDPRFADQDFRDFQNYVGQTITFHKEIVHYICPKPKDVQNLMQGLIEAHKIFSVSDIPAIVHAAVIAYGFVFIHPFEDGNGRIHRFLIHNILARRGFTPKGIMIPVSAAMLRNPIAYDQSLESFSKPLLSQIEFKLELNGEMEVLNETGHYYRFVDMTSQAESLISFISETISRELVDELEFLAKYDQAKLAIQSVVDLPDRHIDLFVNLCIQNHGKISDKKRETHFPKLTNDEIEQMIDSVLKCFKVPQIDVLTE